MRVLINFLNFLTPYGPLSYFVIFAVLIGCGFGLPMPEDVILVTGGILAAREITHFWLTVTVGLLGVLVGDGTIFIMGRYFGPRLKEWRFFRWVLSPSRDELVSRTLNKYGDKVIFMARFMPGLRTPIFFTTGLYKTPFWKFLMLDGFAALISVPLWIYVGFLFGSNLEHLEKVIKRFQTGIYTVLGAAILFFAIYRYLKKRFEKVVPDEVVPDQGREL